MFVFLLFIHNLRVRQGAGERPCIRNQVVSRYWKEGDGPFLAWCITNISDQGVSHLAGTDNGVQNFQYCLTAHTRSPRAGPDGSRSSGHYTRRASILTCGSVDLQPAIEKYNRVTFTRLSVHVNDMQGTIHYHDLWLIHSRREGGGIPLHVFMSWLFLLVQSVLIHWII